jgi:hypothetical protein
VHTVKRRKANAIGYMLHGNCLVKHVVEGKIEMRIRGRRRCRQLVDDFKGTEGSEICRKKK